MLKYRLNKDNVRSDNCTLNIVDYNVIDNLKTQDDINEVRETNFVTFVCEDLGSIKPNDNVFVNHSFIYLNENYVGDKSFSTFNAVKKYNIGNSLNPVSNSFTVEVPRYTTLPICHVEKKFEEDPEGNEVKEYYYLTFSGSHMCTAVRKLSGIKDIDPNLYVLDDLGILRNLLGCPEKDEDESKYDCDERYGYEIVTSNVIKIRTSDINSNELDIKPGLLTVYRKNYLFSDVDNFSVYYHDYKCSINVGLKKVGQTDLLKEQSIVDYCETSKERAINKIIDMEKDTYYPVSYDGKVFNYLRRIKFNLHFLQHLGDDWITSGDSLWNGYNTMDDDKARSYFFSYGDFPEDRSCQSDLLCYLGFSNNDVKYQKSRLKKSFLRLSFYDSMNPGDQNLLSYQTIFFDSGKSYGKYIKYLQKKPYSQIFYDEDGNIARKIDEETNSPTDELNIRNDFKGARVEREPYDKLIKGKTHDEIEDFRLSSQFMVTDKYVSDTSSEGFYLYLWKDILPVDYLGNLGVRDVYMKVEFNHAGYGRVIPLMMPYWDKKKWSGGEIKKYKVSETDKSYTLRFKELEKDMFKDPKNINHMIKTYDEVLDDWTTDEYDEEHIKDNDTVYVNTDGKYSAKQYIKFSYVHIKIGYDEINKKYIYYLDDDTYGFTQSTNDEDLVLNLYEAKLS